MIWIRADANRDIGAGHIMRCLSVAKALQDMGEEVLFLVADEASGKLLAERDQAYRVLHSPYRELERELPTLLSLLQTERPKLFLLDSYFVTKEYLKQVGSQVKTAYLDDCGMLPYPVDILVNYNIYGDQIDYRSMFADDGSDKEMQLLFGPSYAPLRPEFSQASYTVRDRVENVLVTTGGSDQYNLAGRFLDCALADDAVRGLHYHVVSGAFNPHISKLIHMSEKYKNIHIHQNVKNMAALMQDCDLAISAGGSTLYELCAIGVPFLCFSFVSNQEQIVQSFFEQGITCYGGNYKEAKESLFQELTEQLVKLVSDPQLRLAQSERQRKLVDARGAARLAGKLLSQV